MRLSLTCGECAGVAELVGDDPALLLLELRAFLADHQTCPTQISMIFVPTQRPGPG